MTAKRSFIINDLPKKRSDALSLNSAFYYTGVPCKRGHIEPRRTSGSQCHKCHAENNAHTARTPKGIIRHREDVNRWRSTQKGMMACRQKSSNRRAMKRNALPQWANIVKINEFIASCPPGFDVDHILPLAGKNVCGLHVLENLQFLPKADNCSKHNKVDPLTLLHTVCPLPGHRTYMHI